MTSAATNVTPANMNCIVLQYEEFIPWNNPDNIVSFEVEDIARKLKDLLFLPILFLIGCPANLMNMAVFYRQGLKERINVCLFALSLADGLYLANNMMWFGEQLYIQFTTKEKYGPVTQFMANNHLIGFHGFIWVSQVLSAIIASERCFCILQPLRSQTVLSTSSMTTIIIGINIVVIALSFIIMTRYHITCAYDPVTDSYLMITAPGAFYLRHEQFIIYLDVVVFGAGLPGLVMTVVIISTIITIVKLGQAASWRAETSSRSGLSQRDIAVTKMLVANSIFFIVCVIPFAIFRLIFLCLPEVNTGRRQHNFYMVIQWLLVIISYFNATFNFFVYYTMGSRFRQTFWQLFRRKSCKG